MVPFWVLMIIRHLIFRVPQKGAIILTTTHMLEAWLELRERDLRVWHVQKGLVAALALHGNTQSRL